jgi:hypothetical protein
MFSSIYEVPKKQLKRLEESWAGTFYREFFLRVEEDFFAVLYSDEPSRPNIPINVLMGLETLKSGYGCSSGGRSRYPAQVTALYFQRRR